MFEIIPSTLLSNHAPGTMPSVSPFAYFDFSHFSKYFDISHIVLGLLLPEELMYVYSLMFF